MKIIWNQVTRLSQGVAIVLFAGVFILGIFLGRKLENQMILGDQIASARFSCADEKVIQAVFYKNLVKINTHSLGTLYLQRTISASGARYSNDDESVVFWNKGNRAFITQGDLNNPTYNNCTTP